MAATLSKNCSSCGGIHNLILFSADMFDGDATYEYTCPSTADAVRVQIDEWARVTNAKPPDAVVVVQVEGENH
jgi:hypothetical protein